MKLLLFASMLIGSLTLSFLGPDISKAQSFESAIGSPMVLLADSHNLAEEGGGGETPPASNCQVEGVGWIICPVFREMAKIVDGAYLFVSELLKVQPLMTTGSGKAVYDTWRIMLNFANVAFVIAFLFIIFSQLTSVGINNYGIKKMLPRLVVAAILVNASFWICAIAVDVSNILGSSMNSLFNNALEQGKTSADSGVRIVDGTQTGEGWEGIVGLALAGTIAGIGVGYATMAALGPALVAALIAIVTVFLVLTLRQALIILLVVIAPLAFVAYLLPNTESLFKKWLGMFKTLLLMYPIIAAIFGASALASTIVMEAAAQPGADGNPNPFRIAVQIMGALISILPLALTPIVMKVAGGTLNRFGGIVNNPNKGPADALRRKAENFRDYRQALAKGRRIKRAENFRNGKSFNGKVGKALFGDASTPGGRADRAAASRLFGGAYEANQRERKRKDVLGAYESEAERAYNESAEGQKYASAAIQAKNRAGTASTNVAALAAETTEKTDLTAAQSAKDRQATADNNNQAFAESNRDLGSRLEVALSKSRADEAQKIGEATIEELKADDAVVPTPLMTGVQQLRDSGAEMKVAASRIDSAQRVQAATFNDAVVKDPTLATRMGGVDKYGAQRAVGIATAASFKEFDDAVSNERKTMTKIVPSRDAARKNGLREEDSLEYIMENASESVERRAAAASMIVKAGSDKDIINTFDHLGKKALDLKTQIDATPTGQQPDARLVSEYENIKSVQQQVAADIGQRKPTSIGAGVISAMGRGQFAGTFNDQVIDRTGAGKMNAEGLARTSADELIRMDEVYTAKLQSGNITTEEKVAFGKLSDSINKFRNDPLNKGKQPPQEITDLMDKIESDFRQFVPAAQQAPTPPSGGSGTLNVPHNPQPTPQPQPQQPQYQQSTPAQPQYQQPRYASPANSRTSMPPNTGNFPQTPNGPGGLYVPNGYQQTPPQQPPQNPPQGPPSNNP